LVVLIQRVKRRRNVAFIIAVALKYWKSTYDLESSSGSLQQRQQCAGREAFLSLICNMPIDVSNKLAKARGI
jgi:hypothetical protein